MVDDLTVKIAGLTILFNDNPRPVADASSDANWPFVRAECRASGAIVQANGSFLYTRELDDFRAELQLLDQGNSGQAHLKCMEPELGISMERKGSLGQLSVVVNLTPDQLSQQHRFVFDIDVSYLPEIIASLNRVLAVYPVHAKGTM